MHSIHESLNAKYGESELFNIEKLKNYKIENTSDLLLLFLPNFSIETPFHFLLLYNNYTIFNDLVESVGKHFMEFINCEIHINKIMMLFVYILEEHCTYQLNAIRESYCELPFDMEFLDFNDPIDFYEYDNDSDQDKLSKKVRENRMKLKIFLNEIINKILKNDSFVNRNDFNC